MKQNLLGVLAGDVAYSLGARAGIHFDCAKEELISVEDEGDHFTEQMAGANFGRVLHRRRGSAPRRPSWGNAAAFRWLGPSEARRSLGQQLSFVSGENQIQFAHGALVQLLAWERPTGAPQNWRHLLRRLPLISNRSGEPEILGSEIAEVDLAHLRADGGTLQSASRGIEQDVCFTDRGTVGGKDDGSALKVMQLDGRPGRWRRGKVPFHARPISVVLPSV